MKKRKKIQIFRLEDRVLFEGAAAAEAVATVNNAGNPSHADKPAPGQEAKDNVQKDAVHDVVQAAGPVSDPAASNSSSTHTAPNAPVQDHGAGLPSADRAAADPTAALVDGTAHLTKLTDPGESFSTDLSDFLHSDLSSHSTSSALFSSSLPADADHANTNSLSHAETKQLIVIEADAADNVDPHTLEGKEVLVLKKDADTSAQIDAYLEAHNGVKYDAIQIVSSKAEKALSSNDLSADALTEIQSHLTDHGSLGFVDAADFNANPANAPHDLSHGADSHSTDNLVVFPDHETHVSVDATTELTTGVSDTADTTVPESLLQDAASEKKELVIVNSNMADLDNVLSQIGDSRDVLIIDVKSSESATQQIQDYLDAHSDTSYDSIHILTHGSSDGFTLGNTVVNDASDMAVFNGHLTQDGDIMIYGCNLASTEAGQHLINDIADVTGADVAASADMTGAAAVGGNWTLEYASGTIETTSISLNSSWNYRLNTLTVDGIGGTPDHYTTIASALTAAVSGDKVDVLTGVSGGNATISLANITITGDGSAGALTVNALGTDITIDTVTSITVSATGSATIDGSTVTGAVTNNGDLTVTSGTFNGAVTNNVTGDLTINGGTFGGTITNNHTATINGGTFNGAATNGLNGMMTTGDLTFTNTIDNQFVGIHNQGTLNVDGTLSFTTTTTKSAYGILNDGTVNIHDGGSVSLTANSVGSAFEAAAIRNNGDLNIGSNSSVSANTGSSTAKNTFSIFNNGTVDIDGNQINILATGSNSIGLLNNTTGIVDIGSDSARVSNVLILAAKGVVNYNHFYIYGDGTLSADATTQITGGMYTYARATGTPTETYLDGITTSSILQNTGTANVMLNNIQFSGNGTINNSGSELFVTGKFSSTVNNSSIRINNTENGKMHFGTGATIPPSPSALSGVLFNDQVNYFFNNQKGAVDIQKFSGLSSIDHHVTIINGQAAVHDYATFTIDASYNHLDVQPDGQVLYVTGGQASTAIGDFWQYMYKNGIFGVTNSGIINYDRMILTNLHVKNVNPGSQEVILNPLSIGVISYGAGATAITNAGGWLTMTGGSLQGTYSGLENMVVIKCIDKSASIYEFEFHTAKAELTGLDKIAGTVYAVRNFGELSLIGTGAKTNAGYTIITTDLDSDFDGVVLPDSGYFRGIYNASIPVQIAIITDSDSNNKYHEIQLHYRADIMDENGNPLDVGIYSLNATVLKTLGKDQITVYQIKANDPSNRVTVPIADSAASHTTKDFPKPGVSTTWDFYGNGLILSNTTAQSIQFLSTTSTPQFGTALYNSGKLTVSDIYYKKEGDYTGYNMFLNNRPDSELTDHWIVYYEKPDADGNPNISIWDISIKTLPEGGRPEADVEFGFELNDSQIFNGALLTLRGVLDSATGKYSGTINATSDSGIFVTKGTEWTLINVSVATNFTTGITNEGKLTIDNAFGSNATITAGLNSTTSKAILNRGSATLTNANLIAGGYGLYNTSNLDLIGCADIVGGSFTGNAEAGIWNESLSGITITGKDDGKYGIVINFNQGNTALSLRTDIKGGKYGIYNSGNMWADYVFLSAVTVGQGTAVYNVANPGDASNRLILYQNRNENAVNQKTISDNFLYQVQVAGGAVTFNGTLASSYLTGVKGFDLVSSKIDNTAGTFNLNNSTITVDQPGGLVNSAKMTLNLSGSVVSIAQSTTATQAILNDGTLNLTNGSVVGGGKYGIYNQKDGLVNITDSTVYATDYGIYNIATAKSHTESSGQVTDYSVTIGNGAKIGGLIGAILNESANTKVTGSAILGFIYSGDGKNYSGYVKNTVTAGTTALGEFLFESGTLTSKDVGIMNEAGNVRIKGGIINGGTYGIQNVKGSLQTILTIDGGTIKGAAGDGILNKGGQLEINGATAISGKGGTVANGMVGIRNTDGGTVTIKGTISALTGTQAAILINSGKMDITSTGSISGTGNGIQNIETGKTAIAGRISNYDLAVKNSSQGSEGASNAASVTITELAVIIGNAGKGTAIINDGNALLDFAGAITNYGIGIQHTNSYDAASEVSILTISGGTINVTNIGISNQVGKANVTGGTITGGIAVDNAVGATLTIGTDGILTGTGEAAVRNAGTMTISTAKIVNANAVGVLNTGTLTFDNAVEINAKNAAIQSTAETLTITGEAKITGTGSSAVELAGDSGFTFDGGEIIGFNVGVIQGSKTAVTINGGLIETLANGTGIIINAGSALTFTGTSKINSAAGTVGLNGVQNFGTFNMMGGTIGTVGFAVGINNMSTGTATISGGTVNSVIGLSNAGTATIGGGAVTGTGNFAALNNTGILTISGGTIANSKTGAAGVVNTGALTLTGMFNDISGDLAAVHSTAGTVTVSGIFAGKGAQEGTGILNGGTSKITVAAGANINNWDVAIDNQATVVDFNGGKVAGNKTGVMNTLGGTLNVTGTAVFDGNDAAINNDAFLYVTGTASSRIQFIGNKTSLENNANGTATLKFADVDGTGAVVNPQGIVIDGGTVTFENSLIHGHQSSVDGAAIVVNGGTLNLIKDTRVHDNTAVQGGAIYQTGGNVYIDQSAIYQNGKAIYLASGRMDILNSTIADNITGYAITSAGTLYLVNSTVGLNNFGGINITGGDTYILNSIVVANGADNINGTYTIEKYSYISNDGTNVFDGGFDATKGYIPLIKNLTTNPALSTGVLFAKYGDSYAYNLKAGADGSIWTALNGDSVTVNESDILRLDQTGVERKYQQVKGDVYCYVAGATTVTNEYIVTVGGDGATGDTLRNILGQANAEGGGVIYFDTATIGGNIIELTQDISMWINANITINGLDGKYNPGPAITIKVADGITATTSIFTVSNADATFQNLTIQGPDLSGVDGSQGAAIQVSSNANNSLRLDNVTISGGKAALGGAIYNAGAMLVISGGVLTGNSAGQGGSIYNASGSLTISNGSLTGNTATAGNGGAIYNQGGAIIVNGGTLSGNTASSQGGAIYNSGTSVSLTNATVSNNQAGQGGAVYNDAGSLTLNGAAISNNRAADGAGLYLNGGTFATTGNASVLSGNIATGMGGAIYNYVDLTLGSLISLTGNEANQGGAVFNAQTLTLNNVTIDSNTATGQGGAIYSNGTLALNDATISNNNATDGAGLYLNGGSVTFGSQTSTLNGNIATGMGGAIYTEIDMTVNKLVSMTGNKADKGGAVYIDGGTVLMEAAGMAGNEAAHGAAFYLNAGRLDIFNSTIANHKGGYTVTVNGGKLYIVDSTIGLNAKGVEVLNGAEAYVLNSVIVGNGTTPASNLTGIAAANIVASTIGGTTVNGVPVTQELVFGTNTYDIVTGTITLRNHFSNIAARSAYLAGYGKDADGNNVYAYSKDNGNAGSWLALSEDIAGLTITAVTTDQLGNTRLVMAFDTDGNGKKSYLYTAGAKALAESFIRVVTTDQDIVDPADGKMSLREAITLAELVGGGVIVFDKSKMGTLTIKIDSNLGGMTVNSNDIQIDSFTDRLDLGGGIVVPENTTTRITINASGLSSTLFTLNGNAIKFSNLNVNLNSVSATGGAFNISGLSNDVILNSISITFGGSITATGGGVYNAGHGTILTNVSILANGASSTGDGGGIYNAAGASLTMKGGTISNFNMTGAGGGIYNAGTFTIESYTDSNGVVHDVTISGNRAANGGGIYNLAGAALSMTAGTISGNIATTGNGGAIYTASANGAILNNLTISGNSSAAGLGGGIYLADNASMTITGGTFESNNADKGNGGAIYNNGTLTLDNVAFGGNGNANRAMNGGAVWQEKGSLTIHGGTFSYNTATVSGGAIYVNGGSMNMDQSTAFANNTATGNGGAIYIEKDVGNATIMNAVFTANSGDNGGAVYNAGTVIMTGGTFTGNKAVNATAGAGGAIYNDGAMTLNSATVGGSANTAISGGGIYNSANGNLTVNGGSIVNNSAANGGGIYNAGTLKLNADAAGNAVQITGNQATGATGKGGGLYNTAAGLILAGVDFTGNTAMSGQGGAIYNTGTDVTVNGGTYSGNKAKEGGAVYNIGTLVFNGDITGNSTTGTDGKGGGVYNTGTLTFTGTVSGNTSATGGGVYNTGTLTFTGTVSGNSATNQGGGIYNSGTLTIANATIGGATANTAVNGAGIYNATGGTLTLDGVTVSNNIATTNGGGLYNAGSLTLSGAVSVIIGNSAANGGGIYNNGAALTISNASNITGNSAVIGGGIYNNANAALALGNANISGNSATQTGGGLYNALNMVLTVTGGTFAGNTAQTGGGLYNAGTLTLTGSTVGGSVANSAEFGGGIYNSGNLTLDNSKVLGNTATTTSKGGGIYNTGKTLTLSNGTVISLNSAAQGGGIYNAGTSDFVLTGSTITDNTATGDGGGIYNADGVGLTVTGGTISSNKAQNGAGFFNSGILVLTGTTFSGNTATVNGGGLYNTGSMKLDGAVFNKNKADLGGAIYNNSASSVTIDNGTFTGNSAANGGALYNATGTMTVSNTTFGGSAANANSATQNGGAIYNAGILALNTVTVSFNTAAAGGGLYNTSTATIDGGTFAGNSAANGGALYNETGASLKVSGSATFGGSAANANKATNGGAIYNAGDMNLDTVTVSFNSATSAGGGIYNSANGILTLVATAIASNTVTGVDGMGGGLYNAGVFSMTAGSITANTALNGKGGGLYSIGGLLFDVDSANVGTAITGNKALDGAGLYLAGGAVLFNGVSVKDNIATGKGGAIYSSIDLSLDDTKVAMTGNKALAGGAIYTTAGLTLSNITISGNTATNGILALGTGGSLNLAGGSALKLTGNTATNGLIYVDGGSFTLNFGNGDGVNNDFTGNTVVNGGFLYLNSGTAVVTATAGMTGKYLTGFTVTGKGGLFYANGGTLLVENMALTNNTAADGSVLYVAGGTVVIGNSTLALNKGAGATVTIVGGALRLECVTVGLNENIGLRYKGGALTANFTLIAGNTKANLDGIESLSGVANVAGNKLDATKIFVTAGFNQETGTIALRKAWDNPAAAVDAGGTTPGYTVDQRGVSRYNPNMNGKFSVGAYTLIAAPASPWVVTISGDIVDTDDGETSLREAVEYLNANGIKEQIVFDYDRIYSSMTPEQKAVYGTNLVLVLDAALGSLNIKVNGMVLDGKNIIGSRPDAVITVDGSKLTASVFTVTGLNNTFMNLTVKGGSAANGGVFNITGPAEGSSTTTLDHMTITQGSAANGGLIYANGGILAITGGTYQNGKATGSGGLIYQSGGSLLITDAVLGNGKAGGDGGAISFLGTTFDVKNTVISGNKATGNGGAIHAVLGAETNFTLAVNDMSGNSAANGGALYLDTTAMGEEAKLSITGTIGGNTASGNGGAIYAVGALKLNGVNFDGNASTKGNGGAVYATGALTVENGGFTGNSAAKGDGGAIYSTGALTIKSGTYTGNSAGNGGALYAAAGLSVSMASFSSNTATGNGGAIYIAVDTSASIATGESDSVQINNNSALNGGGIYNAGTLTIGKGLTDLSNNEALYNAKNKIGGKGGAIYNSGTLTFTSGGEYTTSYWSAAGNGTQPISGGLDASGNTANSGLKDSLAAGGFLYNSGTATLSNFTISNSSVTLGNGGAIASTDGSVTLNGMILNNNQAVTGDGGAVYVSGGNLTVNSSQFKNNSAINLSQEGYYIDKGGALYFAGTGDLTISSTIKLKNDAFEIITTVFDGNEAAHGGAAYISTTGSVNISNVTVQNNIGRYSNSNGIGDSQESKVSKGAGFWIGGTSSNRVTIENATFFNNYQGVNPGSSTINTWGGGLYVESVGLNLINTTFAGNYANHGAAIFMNNADVSIVNSTIGYNYATDSNSSGLGGGAILVTGMSYKLNMLNTIVVGNYDVNPDYSNATEADFNDWYEITGKYCDPNSPDYDPTNLKYESQYDSSSPSYDPSLIYSRWMYNDQMSDYKYNDIVFKTGIDNATILYSAIGYGWKSNDYETYVPVDSTDFGTTNSYKLLAGDVYQNNLSGQPAFERFAEWDRYYSQSGVYFNPVFATTATLMIRPDSVVAYKGVYSAIDRTTGNLYYNTINSQSMNAVSDISPYWVNFSDGTAATVADTQIISKGQNGWTRRDQLSYNVYSMGAHALTVLDADYYAGQYYQYNVSRTYNVQPRITKTFTTDTQGNVLPYDAFNPYDGAITLREALYLAGTTQSRIFVSSSPDVQNLHETFVFSSNITFNSNPNYVGNVYGTRQDSPASEYYTPTTNLITQGATIQLSDYYSGLTLNRTATITLAGTDQDGVDYHLTLSAAGTADSLFRILSGNLTVTGFDNLIGGTAANGGGLVYQTGGRLVIGSLNAGDSVRIIGSNAANGVGSVVYQTGGDLVMFKVTVTGNNDTALENASLIDVSGGTFTMVNSTVYDNLGKGLVLLNQTGGTMNVASSTLAFNGTYVDFGNVTYTAVINATAGTLNVINSIVDILPTSVGATAHVLYSLVGPSARNAFIMNGFLPLIGTNDTLVIKNNGSAAVGGAMAGYYYDSTNNATVIAYKTSATGAWKLADGSSVANTVTVSAVAYAQNEVIRDYAGYDYLSIGAYSTRTGKYASLIVTISADTTDPYDYQTSLREALTFAKELYEFGGESWTIQFAESTHGFVDADSSFVVDGFKANIDGNIVDASGVHTGNRITIEPSGIFAGGSLFTLVNGSALSIFDANIIGASGVLTQGGAFNVADSTLNLTDVSITAGNVLSGGAIYAKGSTVKITDGSILGGVATGNGGSIYGDSSSFTLNNVRITGGKANEGAAIYLAGGALNAAGAAFSNNIAETNGGAIAGTGAAITLRNSSFTNNAATAGSGGAIYNVGGKLTVAENSFTSNSALGNGGAIYSNAAGVSSVVNGTFNQNGATDGGAVYNAAGNMAVSGSFTANAAFNNGGAVYSAADSMTVSGSFTGNTAGLGSGGAVYNAGGNLSLNGTFTDNSAGKSGGAVYNASGNLSVKNGSFTGNDAADGDGGAIYSAGGTASITGVSFSGNTAAHGDGGAVYNTAQTLSVSGSSFSGNSAANGGAVYNVGTMVVNSGSFTGNTAQDGAAIYSTGSADIMNFSFVSNTASNGSVIKMDGVGSSLYMNSGSLRSNTGKHLVDTVGKTALLTVTTAFNSTASSVLNTVSLDLVNSTITGSTTDSSALIRATNALQIANSIVVGNTADVQAVEKTGTGKFYTAYSIFSGNAAQLAKASVNVENLTGYSFGAVFGNGQVNSFGQLVIPSNSPAAMGVWTTYNRTTGNIYYSTRPEGVWTVGYNVNNVAWNYLGPGNLMGGFSLSNLVVSDGNPSVGAYWLNNSTTSLPDFGPGINTDFSDPSYNSDIQDWGYNSVVNAFMAGTNLYLTLGTELPMGWVGNLSRQLFGAPYAEMDSFSVIGGRGDLGDVPSGENDIGISINGAPSDDFTRFEETPYHSDGTPLTGEEIELIRSSALRGSVEEEAIPALSETLGEKVLSALRSADIFKDSFDKALDQLLGADA